MARTMTLVHDAKTDADVQRLLETFTDLKPDGRVIAHTFIEEALRMRRDVSRYRTVTKHWRRVLFQEQRIFLDGRSAEGIGFKVLTADEMVRFSNREVRAIGRRLKRALLVAAAPMDEEIKDPNARAFRARLLSATEQIGMAHSRVIRELGTALRPPRQLRAVAGERPDKTAGT